MHLGQVICANNRSLPGGRFSATRHIRRSLFAICVSFFPSFGFALDVAQRSADICISADPAEPGIVEALAAVGWSQVSAEQLRDEDILAIAANMLGNRLGVGQAPKARWQAEWQLVQDGAAGKRRVKSIAGAPTQRCFLNHPDGLGLLEVTTQTFPGLVSIDCEITVSEPLANQSLAIVAAQQLTRSNPPIVFTRNQKLGVDPTTKTLGATYYNPTRIPDLIDSDLPFVGTIWVRNSLKR